MCICLAQPSTRSSLSRRPFLTSAHHATAMSTAVVPCGASRDAGATSSMGFVGCAGEILCCEAEYRLKYAMANAYQAHALSQVRAANRDLGNVHSNPNHAAVMGNFAVTHTESPIFVQACRQYSLAKDIVEMYDK